MLFRRPVVPARPVELPLFPTVELKRSARPRNEAMIRGLCANAYLGDHTALCRVLGRYKMIVDTRDYGLSAHLLIDGYWEMWLSEVLTATVKPGMVAVDVGANLGYFSVLMGELVGEQGHVHAFEPNPAIADLLRKTIGANGFDRRTTVHQVALGDTEGAAFRLIVPENEPKNAFIMPVGDEVADGPDIVRTRRLDTFPELLAADVVKIDADTAERSIWRGMRGLFDRKRALTVFLEFNAERYDDPRAFLDEMLAEGFSLAIVDLTDGVIPATVEDALVSKDAQDLMLMMQRG